MHEMVLMKYAALHVAGSDRLSIGERIQFVREIAREYHATAKLWRAVFSSEVERKDGGRVLQEVFELWRKKDEVEATVAWGKWLLTNDRGKEAMGVMVRARSSLKEADRRELEQRWKVTLDENVVNKE